MSDSDSITRLNAALEGRYRIERELGEGLRQRDWRLFALLSFVWLSSSCGDPDIVVIDPGFDSLVIVDSLLFSTGRLDLQLGDTVPVTAVAVNSLGFPVAGVSVEWSSADTTIVSVDSSADTVAMVAAMGVGTTELSASTENKITTIPVAVTDNAIVPSPDWILEQAAQGVLELTSVWGSDAANVYAGGYDLNWGPVLLKFDGTSWNEVPNIWGPTNAGVESIWGSAWDDIHVSLRYDLLHFDGLKWDTLAFQLPEAIEEIWGTERDSVIGVGPFGTVMSYDTLTGWSRDRWGAYPDLASVGWTSGSRIFAVGEAIPVPGYVPHRGTILEYVGGALGWVDVPHDEPWPQGLRDIWVESSDDMFAVGDVGTATHFAGSRWRSIPGDGLTVHMQEFKGVQSYAPDRALAVGYSEVTNGIIGHIVDLTPTTMIMLDVPGVPILPALSAIWIAPDGTVFAVGKGGFVLRGRLD